MAEQMESDFWGRVLGATSQGAVGAVVGAALSAVTEPIVNRVLVKRVPLSKAMQEIDWAFIQKFFNTTISANFIKFPFFEAINVMLTQVPLPAEGRGAMTGAIFTTATLPITNYRYCKSMDLPIDTSALYKAYLPTVIRDIVYGMVRNRVYSSLAKSYPGLQDTAFGRFAFMFATVAASCIISAPGNEYRGYSLQPIDRKLPFNEFFKPQKFLRSTIVGTLVMSVALGTGAVVTKPIEESVTKIKAVLKENPIAGLFLLVLLVTQYATLRKQDQTNALLKEQNQLRSLEAEKKAE